MNKLLSLSIRKQMIVLIIIMSIVPFGLVCYSTITLRSHEIQEALFLASGVASQIDNEQKILTANIEQLAATLNQLPAVRNHDAAVVTQLLSNILKVNPSYSNITLVDKSGSLWASALPADKGLSLADRRYFRQAVSTGKLSSGEYAISKVSHVPIFSFGSPLSDLSGRLSDVLVVSLNLDNYRHLYSGRTTSPVSSILLVDHKGTILFSSVDPKLVGRQDRSDLFKRMTDGQDEGVFEASGNLGIHRLFSYRKLRLNSEPAPYMYIRTGLSAESVFARANREFLLNLALLSTAVVLSLGVMTYVCKRGMFDRIKTIRDATCRIAQGDLDVRIGHTVGGGELGELATAFDTMAGKLASDAAKLSRAHEAQKASELKYRELVENANSIILKWDRDGRVTFFNEYAEKFFGFSNREIIGQCVIGTIVPETESSGRDLIDMMRTICNDPAAFINNENENIRKNGERVWISWNNHPLEDEEGKITGILSVGQDITERKKMEAKLRKSELRFRSFVENVNDVLFALNPSGEFIYVSPQWKEAFGYELSETIGRPFMPFVHPDDVPACLDFMQQLLRTGEKQSGVEYRVLCKNGNYLWYKANASLIVDPVTGIPTLVGIGRDITERKLADETLRQSEEKFAAAFRSSPDAVTLSRLSDGSYLEVNEGFTAMTGYRPEEVLGKSSSDLNMWIDPEQRREILQELTENGTIRDFEGHFRRKDGTLLTGQISARLINITDQPYILSITRDVSEQEQLQKEILKAQKLESISVLAGGIAHNFNNVLTGVIGYISYALKNLDKPGKVQHILESAEKSSYRAAGLARQLLTFAQGGSPVKKNVPIDTLVQESVSLFLSGTTVRGEIDCSSHQTIFADSQLINQAFNNIVLNALQAMPDGGTLDVKADTVTLKAGNRFGLKPAAYVSIVFKDSGSGIRQEHLGKLFDPYFTTKENGTGLGLSTTHSIISKHGGAIDITSSTGNGTAVTVLLPASPQTLLTEIPVPEPRTTGQATARLLVMDDEEMIRDVAEELLSDQGRYQVATCSSGEDAIAAFKAALKAGSPFDLVILDLVVPGGMSGIETARHVHELDPNVLIIASSGYPDDPAITDFAAFGFYGTIVKPYSADELNAVLQDALASRSSA